MVGENDILHFMVSHLQQTYTSFKVRSITYHLYYKVLVCFFLGNKFEILVVNLSKFVTVVTWKPYSCNMETVKLWHGNHTAVAWKLKS